MNIALVVVNVCCCGARSRSALMAQTLSFEARCADAAAARREQAAAGVVPLRVGLPARDGARGRARVHVRGRRRRRASARSFDPVRPLAARAASSSGCVERAARASRRVPSTASSAELPPALVELALWLADYYGSTPARALALVAPREAEAAQGAGAAGRAAGARRARPSRARLVGRQQRGGRRGSSRRSTAAAATSCSTARPASGKTEVYLQACAAVLERGLGAIVLVPEIALAPQTVGRVRARFGDRVAILHSALTDAERRDERERIACGEARDRRRRALGRLRAGARARPDRRRRGARLVVQAGLRPALRRAHGRGQARGARGRRRRLRLRDAAARELGGARAAGARRADRRRRCRRCASSTCAGRPATRSRRRCSPSCGGVAERRRQGDPAPEPARRRAGAALPRLRHDDPLPELRRRARPARRHGAPLPPLRPRRAVAARLPGVRLARPRAARRRHAEARARARARAARSSS